MSEHTPTPWRVKTDFGLYVQGSPVEGERYGEVVINGFARPKSFGSANAAFIVKAVNAWYDVEALRHRIAELEAK